MKKMLKMLLSVALVLAVSLGIAGCSQNNSNSEWNNDISTVQRKKSEAHSPLSSYNSIEEAVALSLKDENNTNYMSLNGTWDFAFTEKVVNVPADFASPSFISAAGTVSMATKDTQAMTWGEITVPGVWETQGYGSSVYTTLNQYPWSNELTAANAPETNAIGLYRRTFEVPADWNGDRVAISFEGVQSAFYVYINGNLAGYAEDSYTTKDFDITSYVKAGQQNTIAVQVIKYSDGSWLEAADSIKYGGIYRDVYLTAFPSNKIMDVAFETAFNDDYSIAMVQATVSLANYTDKITEGNEVKVSIYDAEGNMVADATKLGSVIKYEKNKTANLYFEGEVGGRVNVSNPKLWTAETPYLYTAVVALYDAEGNLLDVTNQKIGLRALELSTDEDGHQTLTINGERLVLYGINYNEHDAETGLTLSAEKMLEDVKLMKSLNINAVRSPGRALSTEFLDLCDEYGIYVVDDASISSNPYSDKGDQSIPGDQSIWQTATLDRLISVMERDKNRASVVVWSIANNSGEGSQINFLKTYLQKNDSRLLIYDGMESVTDIMVAYDWDMTSVYEYLDNSANKKPMIVQTDALGLLNGAGNVSSYVDLFMNNEASQGGFLANWIDYAVKDGDRYVYSASQSNGYQALKGILSADRTLQSDAEEFRRAYSPIAISAVDKANGKYKVTNRNLFTSFEGNYTISYEIYEGSKKVASGDVKNLAVAPGKSAEFTIPYGSLKANTEYFIDFTVKHAGTPAWSSEANPVVTTTQFEITAFATTPKTENADTNGEAFKTESFTVPEVDSSAVNVALGEFFFNNSSLKDLNEMFTLSYRVIENNDRTEYFKQETGEVWKPVGAVVYSQGTVANFSVPAGSKDVKVTIPYEVNGVSTGKYGVEITLTTKNAIGEVPAGYEIVYLFDETTLGENIPFKLDPAREVTPVLDDEGQQAYDTESSYPIMTGGDPAKNTKEKYVAKNYFEEHTSFITLSNSKVSLRIDTTSGLITSYSVNGTEIFANGSTSPIGNFVRQPSSGDLVGDYLTDASKTLSSTVSSSSEGKNLKGNVSVSKVSDSHWKISASYALNSYPYASFANNGISADYSVVYDIYANGEISVCVTYDSDKSTEIVPLQVSNVITLASGFETMTWFGRGPGESYADKLGASRVGLFENVNIKDQIEDYLAMAESSNKTDVRWVALKNSAGNGIMISSDSSNFDLSVTKWYPWAKDEYSSNSLDKETTIVNVIGVARGINSGKVSESLYYGNGSYILSDTKYSFSYKISPITKDTNLQAKASQKITDATAPSKDTSSIVSGNSYALNSVADGSLYLTTDAEGNYILALGQGSDKQIWVKEETKTMLPNTFALKNLGFNKYLTATSFYTNGISAELGLGEYNNQLWQNFLQDNTKELYAAQFYYAMTPVSFDGQFYMGSRIALMPRNAREESTWEFIPVEGKDGQYLVQNIKTGYYLTAADSLTYRNSLIEEIASRIRNYSPSIDWKLYESFFDATPSTGAEDWVKTESTVTMWELLPSNSQKWIFTQSGNGYTVKNATTGKMLTVVDGKLVEGAGTVFTAKEENGKFYLYDEATNLALTALSSSEGGLRITLAPLKNVSAQLWTLSSNEDLKVNIEAGRDWFTVGKEQIVEE